MCIETTESETAEMRVLANFAAEPEIQSDLLWNGRSVVHTLKKEQTSEIGEGLLLNRISLPVEYTSMENRDISVADDLSRTEPKTDIHLYAESVDGEVSISGSIDTEGNKELEVEVDVSSKDGEISGSVSGSVSQDSNGNTSGEVTVRGTWGF